MASIMAFRARANVLLRPSVWSRSISSSSPRNTEIITQQNSPLLGETPPNTHYKITLRRSAISLGDKIKGTLISLGIHRRMQTVYHRHSPEVAGKILRVKELVEVENVPEALVRTKEQQTQDRKATRGYKVVGSRRAGLVI